MDGMTRKKYAMGNDASGKIRENSGNKGRRYNGSRRRQKSDDDNTDFHKERKQEKPTKSTKKRQVPISSSSNASLKATFIELTMVKITRQRKILKRRLISLRKKAVNRLNSRKNIEGVESEKEPF